jgi:two-component system, OmpR family, sensor histidine kinase ChvG
VAVTGQDLPGLRKSAAIGGGAAGRLWRGTLAQLRRLWRPVSRLIEVAVLSSLTRRIIVLNLAGLLVLVLGILFLNQWRAGLIEARVQSLRVQGEIIAAAIAASATADSDVIKVDPERLLELSGDSMTISPFSFIDPSLEFPINPERVAPLLRNLIAATKTRARIYDQQGLLILDSNNLYARGEILRRITSSAESSGTGFFLFDWWNTLTAWLPGDDYPLYQEYGADEGARYPEVAAAMQTTGPSAIVRVDAKQQLVVSVAVPIRRLTATVGVLLLSTQPGEIDKIEIAERWNIVRIALVAFVVATLLSLLLAGTIAGPLRRLSAAAEKVQNSSMSSRAEIPDFSDRTDEVGHLSKALRAMTGALYSRIEAIERFAADVAHELKNPLTSLRSAVETLPRAKQADRERLHAIIQHDVRRLDRLISDISNASRLDAELARRNAERIDVEKLIETMVSIQKDIAAERGVSIVLDKRSGRQAPVTMGQDSRLAQVFANLIDNAASFSPKGGTVHVAVKTSEATITVTVTDEGPGIRGDITRIFQRFYTDRPDGEHFGDHSGLGLSISKQIVEAHGGTISAANREDRSGAVFTVTLPRAAAEKPRK